MRYNLFCVDNKPFCIYDSSDKDINSKYIKNIEPQFYDYVAQQNYDTICDTKAKKGHKQFASISLRNYYYQALETLFALVFATLQAPRCIPGWMIKYRNKDLYKLVKKTNNNIPIKTRFYKIENISWDSIIYLIFCYYDEKESSAKKIVIKNFSELLSSLASDYLDKNLHNEYNSVKHGFRVKAGGSILNIIEVDKNSVAKQNKKSINILQSEYGSSFFIDQKLLDSKNHFLLKHHFNNWSPENIYSAIKLISLLIHNLLIFLKKFNNIATDGLHYKSLTNNENYNLPWKNQVGSGYFTIDFGINVESIKIFSNKEILSSYDVDKGYNK